VNNPVKKGPGHNGRIEINDYVYTTLLIEFHNVCSYETDQSYNYIPLKDEMNG